MKILASIKNDYWFLLSWLVNFLLISSLHICKILHICFDISKCYNIFLFDFLSIPYHWLWTFSYPMKGWQDSETWSSVVLTQLLKLKKDVHTCLTLSNTLVPDIYECILIAVLTTWCFMKKCHWDENASYKKSLGQFVILLWQTDGKEDWQVFLFRTITLPVKEVCYTYLKLCSITVNTLDFDCIKSMFHSTEETGHSPKKNIIY